MLPKKIAIVGFPYNKLILLTAPPSYWIMPSYIVCASCLRERERRNVDVHENTWCMIGLRGRREGKNCNAACD